MSVAVVSKMYLGTIACCMSTTEAQKSEASSRANHVEGGTKVPRVINHVPDDARETRHKELKMPLLGVAVHSFLVRKGSAVSIVEIISKLSTDRHTLRYVQAQNASLTAMKHISHAIRAAVNQKCRAVHAKYSMERHGTAYYDLSVI